MTRGRILDLRAYAAYMYRGDLGQGRALAAEAREIAVRTGDRELEMLSSASLGTVALLAGEPRPDLLARAIELGRASATFRLGRWPEVEQARQSVWAGDLGQARALFDRLFAMTARSGLEFQRPYRLVDLANLELAAGNLAVAARLAGDGIESAGDAGNGPIIAWLRYPDGLAAAHLGDHERAGAAAAAMRAWGTERGELPRLLMAHHVAGVDALARQDVTTARRELDRGLVVARRAGQAHPGVVPVLPDALEAAVAGGDVTSAATLAADLDGQASALSLPWVDAAARRGRGLATLAAGRADAAVADLATAAAAFDELGYGLDAARAIRWHGLALARAGSPAAAERALVAARGRFESLGARPWAEQTPTRGGRPLSVADRRVVELVAAGRRNREIAGDLHVSVGTVEAALTRIYRSRGCALPLRAGPLGGRSARARAGRLGYRRRVTRAPPPGELRPVGRDRELAQLQDVVAGAAAGPRFVVVTGDAGIGKTTVWRAALDDHRRAGHVVVATRPSEEELHGPLTGLFDLFEDVDGGADVVAAELDPLDRGRAVLAVLRAASARAPVVVAVDDLQWLDAVSTHALRYALRRLSAEPVVLLATQRGGEPAGDVAPPGRVEEIALAPAPTAHRRDRPSRHGRGVQPGAGPRHRPGRWEPAVRDSAERRPLAEGDLFGPASAPTLRTAMAARLEALPDDTLAATRVSGGVGPATSDALERACRAPAAAATAMAKRWPSACSYTAMTGWSASPTRCWRRWSSTGSIRWPAATSTPTWPGWCPNPTPGPATSRSHGATPTRGWPPSWRGHGPSRRRGGAHAAVAAELADHSVRLTPVDEVAAWTRRSLTAMSLRRPPAARTGVGGGGRVAGPRLARALPPASRRSRCVSSSTSTTARTSSVASWTTSSTIGGGGGGCSSCSGGCSVRTAGRSPRPSTSATRPWPWLAPMATPTSRCSRRRRWRRRPSSPASHGRD